MGMVMSEDKLDTAKKHIVFASTNPGKHAELVGLLDNTLWHLHSLSEWSNNQVAETGGSFIENALIKARAACELTGLPAIADDSGLCVAALQGKPGLYSARFAGDGSDDQKNRQYLVKQLQALNSSEQRFDAYFICAAVYLQHPADPAPLVAQVKWHGFIQLHEQGDAGFGYDSLFYVPNYDKTAAQLPATVKNDISHRGLAVRELMKLLHELE